MTIPQLTWIIDARRLSEGAMMYSGVWDTLSPLSAGFYWIVYSVFGESFVVIQILSVLLIFLQSTIFNTILINSNPFTENTYIPAIVYVVLASLYFDFFTVSPVMLGITFILLAMNNVFGQIEVRAKRDEKLLSTGIYLGLAALFHFPFFVFWPDYPVNICAFHCNNSSQVFFVYVWMCIAIFAGCSLLFL